MAFRMSSRSRTEWGTTQEGCVDVQPSHRNKHIAITILSLDTEGNGNDKTRENEDIPEMKLVQEFQARRKHNSISKKRRDVIPYNTCLDLGLNGTKYTFGCEGMSQLDRTCDIMKNQELFRGKAIPITAGSGGEMNTCVESFERKFLRERSLLSSRATLPPISPRSNRPDKSTPLPPQSLLNNGFGFGRLDSDSFSQSFNRKIMEPCQIQRELEDQSRRHIYACSHLGSVRKGSRAAQNVDRLKRTMSLGFCEGKTFSSFNALCRNGSPHIVKKRQNNAIGGSHPTLTQALFKAGGLDELPVINGSSLRNIIQPDVT